MIRKSSTETLVAAMRILARDIQSGDGVANAAIAEAADRLAEQQARIAELEKRIDALLEQRNRMGQDVQNAAITGTIPPNHPFAAQLGLVTNLRAKVAELAAKAAIGQRAVLGLRALEWSRPVIDRNGFLGRGCIECGRGRESGHTEKCAAAAILRDAEQAESSNNRVILDSSDHVPYATKMVEQQARISELLDASDAVIERWHTPLWRDAKPTAEYIAALRVAADNARRLMAEG